MIVQIIHSNHGKTLTVEAPTFVDGSIAKPRKIQKLNLTAQRLRNMSREGKLGRLPRAKSKYQPGLITEIRDDACRYIAGSDRICCGAKAVFDSPWCPAHRAIVFRKGTGQ